MHQSYRCKEPNESIQEKREILRSMVMMLLVRQVVPVVHPCPSVRWWRDPECIESRIFADFRRASFTHEQAPAGSPGLSASLLSILRGGLDRGRPTTLHRRRMERVDAVLTCLRERTRKRACSHERALFYVFWNAHTASASSVRTAHGPLVCRAGSSITYEVISTFRVIRSVARA